MTFIYNFVEKQYEQLKIKEIDNNLRRFSSAYVSTTSQLREVEKELQTLRNYKNNIYDRAYSCILRIYEIDCGDDEVDITELVSILTTLKKLYEPRNYTSVNINFDIFDNLNTPMKRKIASKELKRFMKNNDFGKKFKEQMESYINLLERMDK